MGTGERRKRLYAALARGETCLRIEEMDAEDEEN